MQQIKPSASPASLSPTSRKEVPPHLKKNVSLSEVTDKTDFFMVLDGQCYLTFELRINYDQSDTLKYIKRKMTSLEEEGTYDTNGSFEANTINRQNTFLIKYRLSQFQIINPLTIERYKQNVYKQMAGILEPEGADNNRASTIMSETSTNIPELKPLIENFPDHLKS